MRLLIFATALLIPTALSGSTSEGGACSANNTHVDPSTHKLQTDCDDKTFCPSSTSATCQPKQCRRDEFPFGYGTTDPLPPLCDPGTFCPDEGSGCQNLLGVGSSCQLNRDEQCAPPKDAEDLESGDNYFGAICLQSTCMYANVTLGQRCILDDTTYVDIGPDGQQFGNRILRHNCRTPLLYCDASALQCFLAKPVGSSCSLDQECRSFNCVESICVSPPGTPQEVKAWQYAITIIVVIISMAVTSTTLVIIHQRLRLQQHRELRDYYYEQISLRQSMFSLHRRAASTETRDEKPYFAY